MNGLRTAIGFLTRVPIGHGDHVASDDPNRSMVNALPWFPVVGLLIGLSQGLALVGLRSVLPALLSAVLAVAIAALITGAFHHDGLADMADAFGGGWTVEQRFAILKDSRLGTYGTTALVLALATEIAALASFEPWDAFRAAVVAHCLSRAVAVAVMYLAPSASEGGAGMGASYAAGLDAGRTVLAMLVGLVITGLVVGDLVAVLLIFAAVGAAAIAVVALSIVKIGGITGDVLGAVQTLTALATLIVLVGAVS